MKKKRILKIIFVVVSAVAMLSVVLISTFASYGQLYDGFIFNQNRVQEIVFQDDYGEWYNLPGTNLYLGSTIDEDSYYDENVYNWPNHVIHNQTDIRSYDVADYYYDTANQSNIVQVAYSYADLEINPRNLYMDEVGFSRGGSVELSSATSGEQTIIQIDSAYSFYLVDNETLEYSLYMFRTTTYIYLEDDYFISFDCLTGSASNYYDEQCFVETSYDLYNVNSYESLVTGSVDHGFVYAFEDCMNAVIGEFTLVHNIVGELHQDVNIYGSNGIENWEIVNSRMANGYPLVNDGNTYSGILAEVDVEVNFFDWLFQAVGSFLNMNVFGIPGVTYGTLIFFLLSIPLVIVFLRLFAGG